MINGDPNPFTGDWVLQRPTAVPEPASITLAAIGMGIVGFFGARRRRKRDQASPITPAQG